MVILPTSYTARCRFWVVVWQNAQTSSSGGVQSLSVLDHSLTIPDNMCRLVPDAKEIIPFLDVVIPGLDRIVEIGGDPEMVFFHVLIPDCRVCTCVDYSIQS